MNRRVEIQPGVAVPRFSNPTQGRWSVEGGSPGGTLENHEAGPVEQGRATHRQQKPSGFVAPVRRISERDVERSPAEVPTGVHGVADDHPSSIERVKRREIRPQHKRDSRVELDEDDLARAATDGFAPHGATSGERIEHSRALDAIGQDVEQCFADLLGRRTNHSPVWCRDPPALEAPGDDP